MSTTTKKTAAPKLEDFAVKAANPNADWIAKAIEQVKDWKVDEGCEGFAYLQIVEKGFDGNGRRNQKAFIHCIQTRIAWEQWLENTSHQYDIIKVLNWPNDTEFKEWKNAPKKYEDTKRAKDLAKMAVKK